jgi:hypothetical protein
VFDSGGTAFGGWWVDLTNTGIVHYARNESPESARSEPGQGAPPVSATWLEKIDYLYKAWRNKKTQTATEQNIFADNTTTVDQKASVSSDGTTVTVGEMGSGP